MRPATLLISGLSVLLGAVEAQRWGPGMFLTSSGGVTINGFSGVLTPGYPPATEATFVAIWPGLWNGKMSGYDLVQAVTSSHARGYMQSFCGAKPGQWCTQVYVLRSGRPSTKPKGHVLNPTDKLEIVYRKQATDGKWFQSLKDMNTGKMIDTLVSGDIPATKLDIQTEMQQSAKGTADYQVYENVTVTLSAAQAGFGKTLRKAGKVTMDNPTTSDGGKTWHINKIVLGPMYPGTAFQGKSINPGGAKARMAL